MQATNLVRSGIMKFFARSEMAGAVYCMIKKVPGDCLCMRRVIFFKAGDRPGVFKQLIYKDHGFNDQKNSKTSRHNNMGFGNVALGNCFLLDVDFHVAACIVPASGGLFQPFRERAVAGVWNASSCADPFRPCGHAGKKSD